MEASTGSLFGSSNKESKDTEGSEVSFTVRTAFFATFLVVVGEGVSSEIEDTTPAVRRTRRTGAASDEVTFLGSMRGVATLGISSRLVLTGVRATRGVLDAGAGFLFGGPGLRDGGPDFLFGGPVERLGGLLRDGGDADGRGLDGPRRGGSDCFSTREDFEPKLKPRGSSSLSLIHI